jgi:hypothetical protein
MRPPLVTVVTPTIPGRESMLSRCEASVQAQWYPAIEHVVIWDEPTTPRHWGAEARNKGLAQAKGEFIAYLDDDDEFLPNHVMFLVSALIVNPRAQWAYAGVNWQRGDSTRYTFSDPPNPSNVSSILMHRATLPARWEDGAREDWALVGSWLAQEIPYAAINVPTAIAHQEGRT